MIPRLVYSTVPLAVPILDFLCTYTTKTNVCCSLPHTSRGSDAVSSCKDPWANDHELMYREGISFILPHRVQEATSQCDSKAPTSTVSTVTMEMRITKLSYVLMRNRLYLGCV